MRRLLATTYEIQAQVLNNAALPREIVEQAERSMFEVAHDDRTKDFQNVGTVLFAEIDKWQRQSTGITGTASGFHDLDEITGGFQPGNLIVIAARPSMGKSALVTNIAHIPAALTAVMRENACRPDFEPEGSLALKCWFANHRGLALPAALDLPIVAAAAPYDEQIAALNRQIGAVLPRQTMKDASGASLMDPKTQVTSLHGVSMLTAAQYPFETNVCLALLHEAGDARSSELVNVAISAHLNLHGHPALAAAHAARHDRCARRARSDRLHARNHRRARSLVDLGAQAPSRCRHSSPRVSQEPERLIGNNGRNSACVL